MLTTPCSTPSVGERLSLVQALQWLQAAVQSSLMLPAQHGDGDMVAAEAVAANVTSVHQIVLELMVSGGASKAARQSQRLLVERSSDPLTYPKD